MWQQGESIHASDPVMATLISGKVVKSKGSQRYKSRYKGNEQVGQVSQHPEENKKKVYNLV